jgi:hypothetical protein
MTPEPERHRAEHDPQLDRADQAAREEPPARLDEAIRAGARRETRAGPHRLPRLPAWGVPLAAAAAIVVTVSLAPLEREDSGRPSGEPTPARAFERASGRGPDVQGGVQPEPSAAESRGSGQAPSSAAAGESGPKPAAPSPPRQVPVVPGRSAPRLEAAAPEEPREGASTRETARIRTERPVAKSDPRPIAAAGTGRAPWSGLEGEPASRWIERIEELRRLGREREAQSLLAEFSRRFPDRPGPPDSKDRAQAR